MSKARELSQRAGVDGALSNRNLIINGAMQVAQRGTSHSVTGYGSLDRWFLALSGATATLSQESFTLGQTDVVGAEYYAKVAVTTGNNNSGLYYKVEAKDVIKAGGQDVTLSYWAKGTSPTNGLKVGLLLVATGAPTFPSDESVTLTSTWTKYTHTFTLPSFSGTTLDASSYLELHFDQDDGDTGTAAWELNITQVQLEVGDTATPFEHRSYGQELALCQRYYRKALIHLANGGRMAAGSWLTDCLFHIGFPVTMRTAPSLSYSGFTNLDNCTGGVSFNSVTDSSVYGAYGIINTGYPYGMCYFYISQDAEL